MANQFRLLNRALYLPLLTRLITEGIAGGIFDTFDPEGVADMIYGLAVRTNSNILPDGSITTLTRAQVDAMVTASPRSY
ncbi:MAG: hypothetical protein J2P17_18880 [Mycobacterium sp.]|nr:hypothetical protein [Mycobacterium sp.]